MPHTTELISFSLAQTAPTSAAAPVKNPVAIMESAAPTSTTSASSATASPAGQPSANGQSPGIAPLLIPFALVIGMMFLMTTLSGRKEKKKRAALMASLGKGDKIITIGGQIGIVEQVRENEVVIRTDENSNAKARFTKAAIQQILESSGGGSSDSSSDSNGTIEVKAKGEKVLSAR